MDILWLKGSDDLKDAYAIRHQVFIIEQKVPEKEEWDEYDKTSDHILLYQDGKPIGTGRLLVIDGNYFLGRIAVLKEYRGKDRGKILVESMLDRAAQKGANEVHIHAQTYAMGFYEKLGFRAYGETFMEAGIEHIAMKAKL